MLTKNNHIKKKNVPIACKFCAYRWLSPELLLTLLTADMNSQWAIISPAHHKMNKQTICLVRSINLPQYWLLSTC